MDNAEEYVRKALYKKRKILTQKGLNKTSKKIF